MNINKIHLCGRVTKDPELKTLPTGTAVVKFGLATNHSFKNKDGSKKETAQFHNCVAFGRTAEVIAQFVTKGQELYVCGRVEYRQWTKKDNTIASMTEVMVEDFQFGQKAKGQRQEYTDETREETGEPNMPTIDVDEEIRPEELPF
jgi:single-strand DNA-binding protein